MSDSTRAKTWWNHRVIKTVADSGEVTYAIHEVYHREVGYKGWTANPVPAAEDSLEELKVTLERMLRACDKPVLVVMRDPRLTKDTLIEEQESSDE